MLLPKLDIFFLLSCGILFCCSDSGTLAPRFTGCANTTLVVVAHQDDDILFQYPDLQNDFDPGHCLVSVYMTAGQAYRGLAYALDREAGVLADHALMANADNEWNSSLSVLNDRPISTFELKSHPNILIFFLRFSDGDVDGQGYPDFGNESLQKLYYGNISTMTPIDRPDEKYSKDDLVFLLSQIINYYRPNVMRIQDITVALGKDHSDHLMAAQFALDAWNQSAAIPTKLISYADYDIINNPIDLTNTQVSEKEQIWFSYAKYDDRVCQTPESCDTEHKGIDQKRFQRQYQVGVYPPH